MNSSIKALISYFKEHRVNAFLVTKDVNIRYLTGFPASESWLLVLPRENFYITDFRYVLEAKKSLHDVKVVCYKKSITDTVFELCSSRKIRKIGFDDRHISLATFERLKKSCHNKIKLISCDGIIEKLREIKNSKEINQVRKALKLNLEAYTFLKGVIKPGISEKDVLRRLENYVKGHGAGFSFDPIVASGPNSCYPHARVSDRKIRNNELVLVDMGMDIGGYKSDLTRVFFLGKIASQIREVCDVVSTAQQKAIAKIRSNILAHEVDFQARNHIAKKGLGKLFGHSLGHGVGLEIHEGPTISQKSPAVLKEGMIFTVEPAVYIPNKFGIRIEDMVLVTKEGCEVLSRNKKTDQICP